MIQALGHTGIFYFDKRGGQNRLLSLLPESGSITQKELAERLGVRPATASDTITRLEEAGLVKRSFGRADRRFVHVALTELGIAKRKEYAREGEERRKSLFTALTEEEKSTLLALLEKLYASWYQQLQEIAPGRSVHDPGEPKREPDPDRLEHFPEPEDP